ncbi:hypothetical protein MGH68_19365 [Erysipelothrix sp. D19-032]
MEKLTLPFKRYIGGFVKGDTDHTMRILNHGFGGLLKKAIYKRIPVPIGTNLICVVYATIWCKPLAGLVTLGTNVQGKVFDEALGIYIYTEGDNSMLMLLFGVFCIFIILGFLLIYFISVKGAINNQKMIEEGHPLPTFKEELKTLRTNASTLQY